MRALAIGVSKPERIHQHFVVYRSVRQSLLFCRGERSNAVVEMRNEDAAILILHPGEQLRQHHGGIRSPVAIVSAVQAVVGAVECDLKMRIATRAKDYGLLSALIDWPVADKPDISMHEVAIGFENLLQVW